MGCRGLMAEGTTTCLIRQVPRPQSPPASNVDGTVDVFVEPNGSDWATSDPGEAEPLRSRRGTPNLAAISVPHNLNLDCTMPREPLRNRATTPPLRFTDPAFGGTPICFRFPYRPPPSGFGRSRLRSSARQIVPPSRWMRFGRVRRAHLPLDDPYGHTSDISNRLDLGHYPRGHDQRLSPERRPGTGERQTRRRSAGIPSGRRSPVAGRRFRSPVAASGVLLSGDDAGCLYASEQSGCRSGRLLPMRMPAEARVIDEPL
jgi:hypothetical protein